MRKSLITLFSLLAIVSLSGCGSKSGNNVGGNVGSTVGSETVNVSVFEKEGASVFIPQFDNLNIRGIFRTVSVSSKSNKFVFDWNHSTNIYKVWSLDTSQKKASMIFSSEIKQGKLENLPVVVSWSPDESKIIMVLRDGESNFNLYTINPDGSGLDQLTTFSKDSKGSVNVSPDELIWDKSGKKIIFADTFYKDREKKQRYSKFKSIDIENKAITEIGGMDGGLAGFSWITDKDIIFLINPSHADGEPFFPDSNLFILDTQSGAIKPFTSDGKVISTASVSPDKTKVVYFVSGNTSPFPPVLVIADTAGNVIKKIENFQEIPGDVFQTKLVWSPDSTKIAFIPPGGTITNSKSICECLFIADTSSSEIKKNLLSSLKPQFILKWGDDGKIYLASGFKDSLFIVYNPNQ